MGDRPRDASREGADPFARDRARGRKKKLIAAVDWLFSTEPERDFWTESSRAHCEICRETSPGFVTRTNEKTGEEEEVFIPVDERPCTESAGPFCLRDDHGMYKAGVCARPLPTPGPLGTDAFAVFLVVHDQWILGPGGPVSIDMVTARAIAEDLGVSTRGHFWAFFRQVIDRRVKWLPKPDRD